jgi:hypothetical protein
MRKGIFLLAVLLFGTAFVLYGKKIRNKIYEKPSAKTVEFSVYAGSGYSSSLYKKSKAKVVLTVYKYAGDSREIVWEGNIDKGNIKNYPLVQNAVVRRVSIYNVYESRETLVAAYKVVYKSKDSEFSYEDGTILTGDKTGKFLKIKI